MNRRKPYGLYIMLVLAALWIVFFLCAPYIAPYNPEVTNVADRLQDISSTHWLGTDQLGRDVWSRILYGGKASLWIAFTIIGISGAIGIVIGGLAGFSTPRVDRWLSRLIDLVLGFPNMVIAIAFIGIMGGPSITNVIISLCITKWAEYARITRGPRPYRTPCRVYYLCSHVRRFEDSDPMALYSAECTAAVINCHYSTFRGRHHYGGQFLAHRHRCATA